MGLLDDIKNGAKQTASNKGKIFYVKSGEKKRIRILTDIEDGIKVQLWSSYKKGIDVIATEDNAEIYENDEDFKLKTLYGFSVYDIEKDEVLLMLYGANNFTPLPQLSSYYEEFGDWCDRDFVIKCEGSKLNKKYLVMPQAEKKMKSKVKALTEKQMMDIVNNAYPDEEEEEAPKKSKGNKKKAAKEENKKSKSKAKEVDEWDDEDEEEEAPDYSEMTAKELYALCKKRDIECQPKKKADYYIELLEEADEDDDEWDD